MIEINTEINIDISRIQQTFSPAKQILGVGIQSSEDSPHNLSKLGKTTDD